MTLSDRLAAAQHRHHATTTPAKPDYTGTNPHGAPRLAVVRDPFADLKRVVHAQLVSALGPQLYDVNMTQSDLELQVRAALATAVAGTDQPMTASDRNRVTQEIADEILGYGPLEPLLRDPDLSEVMVNGAERRSTSSASAS